MTSVGFFFSLISTLQVGAHLLVVDKWIVGESVVVGEGFQPVEEASSVGWFTILLQPKIMENYCYNLLAASANLS